MTIWNNRNRIKNIKSTNQHKQDVNSVSIFPSEKILSVSKDKLIIIYDIKFNEIQIINNAHNDIITYVEIQDENSFVTSSLNKKYKNMVKKWKW